MKQKFFNLQKGEKILKGIKPLPVLKNYFFVTSLIVWFIFIFSMSLVFVPIFAIYTDNLILAIFWDLFFIFILSAILTPVFWLIAKNLYNYRYYWITNKRVICKRGLLGYTIASVPYERISDIIVTRRFLERLLGFGSLYIQSLAGQIGMEITFQAVPDPEGTQKLLFDLVKKKRRREHITF